MFGGCGRQQTLRVSDVSKAQTILLKADPRQSHIYHISLRFRGQIDGRASISGKNVVTQSLQGKFDAATGGDWYTKTCELEYSPTNVHSGHMIIEFEFHD
jgi:hypothetical protein